MAWRSINTIRALAMDAVQAAESGHPGTPMSLAPAAYVLWHHFLRHNPHNPHWDDRDRFVLSCGHASMLLYSLLYLTGYDLSLDEIRNFRQWGSKTPGHPERGHTAGVETTTGPLGQGVGNAVGMAIAERFLARYFNRPDFEIVNHLVWAFASDGDIMEGVSSEASSIAGHLQLGNLCLIYDNNHITIDGRTDLSFSEDVGKRYEAYGWHVQHVESGNDLDAIARALTAARDETARPSMIVLHTVIGDPAPTKKDSNEAHGSPLGPDEVRKTKGIIGWPEEPPFFVPPEALAHWREAVPRGEALERDWNALFDRYAAKYPDLAQEYRRWMTGELPKDWDRFLPAFTAQQGAFATRQASGKSLEALAKTMPNLIGGSADLGTSTGVTLTDGGEFGPGRTGRILHWGIREHGMGACMNGIAAHGGLRPFGSTFFVFTDYMKPAIRLAAIMKLPTIYICTHDSIGLGEDGPTHQPIAQLAMLRALPGLRLFRPADATETVEAWRYVVSHPDKPSMLVLTRQKVPTIDRTKFRPVDGLRRGAYILSEPDGGAEAILIGTGSEVGIAIAAADQLAREGIRARVVSMPSWDVFADQSQEYRDEVLPPAIRARVAIEAAATMGWLRWVTDEGVVIGIDHFGASAPAERIYQEFGLTPEAAATAVRRLLQQKKRPA
ncbi:MAG: transketolase [Bacillota bacterium]